MPTLNLNTSPYFDDYQQQLVDGKDYVRVLFRPGFAVQARELTQLQSIMQEQVTRFGNHIFRDGSIVQNGEIKFINDYDSITIGLGAGRAIADYSGRVITGMRTGVKARVIDTDGINRLFLRYLGEGSVKTDFAGDTIGTVIYEDGAVLEKFIFSDDTGAAFTETLEVLAADNAGQSESFDATLSGVALGSAVSIVEGTYYVDGIFTRVLAQTLVLDINNPRPSFRVGFELQSSVVTSNEDSTLVDNSRGTTNTGAPGATRLENRLLLAKRDLNAAADEIFIEVVRVQNGVVQNVLNNPQYADLLKTFARRTFDESGNYALDPFTPSLADGSDISKFNVSLAPSKAYVQGYEIETVVNTDVEVDRARDTLEVKNFQQSLPVGNYFEVDAPADLTDLANLPFGLDATTKLYLRNRSATVQTLGYAHIRGYDTRNNRLYVYDVRPFTRVELESDPGFSTGDVVRTRRGITGVVAGAGGMSEMDDSHRPTDGALYLINVSGAILANDVLTSQTNTSTFATVTTRAETYRFIDDSDSSSISAVGTRVASDYSVPISFSNGVALQGVQSSLVYDTQREIQAAQVGNERSNDFQVIATTAGFATRDQIEIAGDFEIADTNIKDYRVNDGPAIPKSLTYEPQVLSIFRDEDAITADRFDVVRSGTAASTQIPNLGYGWAVGDREISLQYADVYRVYAIYDSLDRATSPVADRLNLQSGAAADTFDNGETVVGTTSGAEAFVIRTNDPLGGNIEFATGDVNILEVLVTNGTFQANEFITSGTKRARLAVGAIGSSQAFITPTSHVNIAGSYNLDNGQRSDYYDIARLVRKTGTPAPQGQIMVVLARWSVAGDVAGSIANHYYNIDSYPNDEVNFFNIDPRFNTTYSDLASPFARERGVNLRNAIDFRRRVRARVLPASVSDISFVANPFSFRFREFISQAYVLPNNSFTIRFDYYIPRRDKIVLNQVGEFQTINGVSDINPRFPESPENVMTLNTIDIPAYTRYIEDVTLTTINNRRYTMSDIGDLDARLRNVETAISLTALESNVFNADIRGADGDMLQRFKSGFVTDDFINVQQTSGDFDNAEFNVAYDIDEGLMQPTLVEEMWRMREQNPSASIRNTNHYTVVGGLAMLPYEEVEEIAQNYATVCLRINPHAVWIFGGEITLTPSSDFWDTVSFVGSVIQSFQNLDGTTVQGPFTIDQVPENVRQSILTGRTVGTPGTTTSSTTSRTIGSTRSSRFNRQFGVTEVFQATTSQATRTVRQAIARDLTSSRVVGDRVVTPRASQGENSFIRAQIIMFNAIDFKPNSLHTMFFDGQDITARVGDAAARTTNNDGTLSGSFSVNMLPEDRRGSDQFRFKTGVRKFSIQNDNGTSAGETMFTATHFITERQSDIVSTRTVVPAGRILGSSTSNSSSRRLIARFQDNDNSDPIAQSFFVDQDMFVTSIDIRFCVVDENAPNHVEVEIRNMVNGYPGTMIVPGGKVSRTITELTSATFNVADDTASSTLGDTTTASKYTRITFKNPVYLEGGGRDYCFVLKSPSPATSVWTAIRGQVDVRTTASVDDQPYLGSSFVSQNNITWNAEQNRDITFRIRRANFDVSRTGILTLGNDTTETNTMFNIGVNPARAGLAVETDAGSLYVTIIHPSHGMYDTEVDNRVTIAGVTGAANMLNGIPVKNINGTHIVTRPTLDTYQILVDSDSEFPTNMITTGCGGGAMVQASQNWQYDRLTSAIQTFTPDSVNIDTSISTTAGTSLWLSLGSNGTISNIASTVSDRNPIAQRSYEEDEVFSNITLSDDIYFNTPRLLANNLNKSGTSLLMRLELSVLFDIGPNGQAFTPGSNELSQVVEQKPGENDIYVSRVSPVIDLASNNGLYGAASIVDNNARDTATGLSRSVVLNDDGTMQLVGNGIVGDGTNTVTAGATPPAVILSMNHSQRSITDSQVSDLAQILDSDPDNQDSISFHKQGMLSNMERTAYVTKEVTLENEADRITVIFDVDAEPGNDIRIWIKTSGVEDDTPLSELDWRELSNTDEFELSRGPINDANDELSSSVDFKEFTFDSGDNAINSFNIFAIRITIDTQNEAEPPRFANFRTIATA